MEVEAEVPRGVQPGETFTVQTPSGLQQVKVPPNCPPGEKLRVWVPPQGPPSEAPVLLGRVVASPGQLPSALPHPSAPTVVVYRVNPMDARVDNVLILKGIPVEMAERKVREIRKGGELARSRPAFPDARKCTDALWIVPFLLAVAAMVVGAVYFGVNMNVTYPTGAGRMVAAGIAGGVASLFVAMPFVFLASCAPGVVVWTSLLFTPTLFVAAGLAHVFVFGINAVGLIYLLLGILFISCIFMCYRPFIPFTITIVGMVASVIKERPFMIVTSISCSVVGLAWAVAFIVAYAGAFTSYGKQTEKDGKEEQQTIYAFAVLIFLWGSMVATNVCHVTNCGVFGRWYYATPGRLPVCRSLWVALTTSFGSICLGSLCVAFFRALEFGLTQARVGAQEDGNPLACIVLMVLECAVACVGDIFEYLSEWAYVQCAVRGVAFFEAARITYGYMTCANMFYVLQSLLINSVVNLTALLSGLVGFAVGLGVARGCALDQVMTLSGALVGLFAGLLAGGSIASIISSGTKSLLVLWAEDPEPLRLSRPELHRELENKIFLALEG